MRHGAGTDDGHFGRGESGAGQHDAAVLDRRWCLTLPLLAIMVSELLAGQPLQHLLGGGLGWFEFAVATPVVVWGGWPLFRAGMGFDHQPQPEYVHADRGWVRNGLSLQRRGRGCSGSVSCVVPHGGWDRWGSTLRQRL